MALRQRLESLDLAWRLRSVDAATLHYLSSQLLHEYPTDARVQSLFLATYTGTNAEAFEACEETQLMSNWVRFWRFCDGHSPPCSSPGRMFQCSLDDDTPLEVLDDVDVWGVVSEHLALADRRAFSGAARWARRLDADVWRATPSEIELLPTVALRWQDLEYLARLPVVLRAGDEMLLPGGGAADPINYYLVACAAIRALDGRRAVGPLGASVELGHVAADPAPNLSAEIARVFAGRYVQPGSTRRLTCINQLVCVTAALVRNPAVARAPRPCRRRAAQIHPAQLIYDLGASARVASFVIDALPWGWLWDELYEKD